MSFLAPLLALATLIPVTEPVPAPALVGEVRIASNGTDAALAVWSNAGGVYATRIDANGRPLDSAGILLDTLSSASVAGTSVPDGWIAIWTDGDHERTRFIARDGSLAPTIDLDLGSSCYRPEIASNGTRVLATCSGNAITVALFDTHATPMGNAPIGRSGGSPASMAISADSNGFVIFAPTPDGNLQPGLWALRVDLVGRFSSWKPIAATFHSITSVGAGFNGTSHVAVWREPAAGATREAVVAPDLGTVSLRSLNPDATDVSITPDATAIALTTNIGTFAVSHKVGDGVGATSIASVAGGALVAWRDLNGRVFVTHGTQQAVDPPQPLAFALPDQQNARVAFDGINRATVWEEGGVVKANILRPDGTSIPGGGVVISSAGSKAHSPAIAALPGLFFIAWIEDHPDPGGPLYGRFYTRELEPVGAPFVVAASALVDAPRLAFDHDAWVVAFTGIENHRFVVETVRVSATGGVLDPLPTVIDHVTSRTPDVTWKGSQYIVTWVRTADVNGILVRQSVAIGGPNDVQPIAGDIPGTITSPRIAASDSNVLLTWVYGTALVARLNPAGEVPGVRGVRRRVVASPSLQTIVGPDVARYTLAWNGAAFDVVWQPRRSTATFMRTLIDQRTSRATTSLLAQEEGALLEDSVGAKTLVVSKMVGPVRRLFWLLP